MRAVIDNKYIYLIKRCHNDNYTQSVRILGLQCVQENTHCLHGEIFNVAPICHPAFKLNIFQQQTAPHSYTSGILFWSYFTDRLFVYLFTPTFLSVWPHNENTINTALIDIIWLQMTFLSLWNGRIQLNRGVVSDFATRWGKLTLKEGERREESGAFHHLHHHKLNNNTLWVRRIKDGETALVHPLLGTGKHQPTSTVLQGPQRCLAETQREAGENTRVGIWAGKASLEVWRRCSVSVKVFGTFRRQKSALETGQEADKGWKRCRDFSLDLHQRFSVRLLGVFKHQSHGTESSSSVHDP